MPNPNPRSEQNRGGGKGATYLALLAPPTVGEHGPPSPTRSPARLLAQRGQSSRELSSGRSPGTTEKPLDGGAPTQRWTRAPASGLAVAPPPRLLPPAGRSLSLG
ncbi:hypothetical protein PAHAL_6G012900 [Panicum hallii]|uniref:Uncharacterized protein n=1 Tax=Panicum hallii TaxID=206008 RepID=A0A2T8IER1_9POAL|nr:hypothetical protein PAHAL_6G012900 [Panicum hallii]